MKKVFVTVVVMVATVTMSSAQVFIGGSLNMNLSGGTEKDGNTTHDLTSSFSFGLSPKVGFYLSDVFAIGCSASLSGSATTTPNYLGGNNDRVVTSTNWGLGGFVRYHILELNKFTALLDGSLNIGGTQSTTKIGSTSTDGNPTFTVGISVAPVLSYSLTDRFSLETSCDFLKLAANTTTTTNASDSKKKTIKSSFDFGVNNGTNRIFSSLVNVGVIYKF